MNVGQAIKALRRKRNMTQGELASCVGMSVNAVSSWELGKSFPSNGSIKLVCDALNIPVSYLMLFTVEEKDVPGDKRAIYNAFFEPLKDELLRK